MAIQNQSPYSDDDEQENKAFRTFKTISDNADHGIVVSDVDGKIKYMNSSFASMHGYSVQELIGKHISFLHPDDSGEDYALHGVLSEGLDIHNHEILHQRKDGSIFPLLVNAKMIIEGNMSILSAMMIDISGLKVDDIEHKVAREQFTSILESSSELIFTVDSHGAINEWNRAISKVSGLGRRRMQGKSIFDENLPEELESIYEFLRMTFKTNTNRTAELRISDANGTLKTLLANSTIIRNDEIEKVIFLAKDVSSKKDVIQNIEHSNAYLTYSDSFDEIIRAFNEYGNKGYGLLFITRGDVDTSNLNKDVRVVIMKHSSSVDGAICYDIFKAFKDFMDENEKGMTLINRLDYLSVTIGFDEMLKFLYRLNNLIIGMKHAIIINIDKDCFDAKQISFLKTEFNPLVAYSPKPTRLSPKQTLLLKFIYDMTIEHKTVNYNMIAKKFEISRLTARRWIKELHENGHISIEPIGKIKRLQLSDKGKEALKLQDE